MSDNEIHSAPHDLPAIDEHAARNRLVITLLLVSTFVVILNETIMSVALPTLIEDLHITESAGQWLTAAFLLTSAIVIPITGWLLQRYSTRRLFLTAMGLFTAGTLIAGLAPGFTVLLVARIVQASGTAIMLPLLFTTVLTLVAEQHRGRVMGNISIVISVAPAIGPVVGAAVLSAFHEWRAMFFLVLPLAIAAIIIGAVRVPNVTEPKRAPLDALSIVLSAFGFGGLVFGLSQLGPVTGGTAPAWVAWGPLGVAVVSLALFVWRQTVLQRTDAALLDLRTFRSRTFSVTMAMAVVSMSALFGSLTLLPLYMQNVLHLPVLTIGLSVLPGGLIMGLLAPLVGRLFDRIGPLPLVVGGSIVVSIALWGMAMFLTADTGLGTILTLHIVLSVGFAFMFTPLFTSGLGSVQPQLYAHGSAILGTIQQVAGAGGVAIFVTVLAAFAGDTTNGVKDVAAYAEGAHWAFVLGAALTVISIPLSFFVRRPTPADGADRPAMAH